jgi:poly-beta-1,6-N-acetyl-D-glucosamine synthase
LMTYTVITPARNEAGNLERLGASLVAQTVRPRQWVVVENGSTDDTRLVAERLADSHEWISVVVLPTLTGLARGGPIVRAFHRGLEAAAPADVVVKLDADVSLPESHFERMLEAFQAEPSLGIASGTCLDEAEGGERFLTADHVWGAARCYRRECLDAVRPLEERMGWDGVDELKAAARGWTTRVVTDTQFRHHRLEGGRDVSRWQAWRAQGDVAWFMRYRPLYLVARTAFQAAREPAAISILVGYTAAALRRMPQLADPEAVALLRRQQRLRELPARVSEAMGRQPARSAG